MARNRWVAVLAGVLVLAMATVAFAWHGQGRRGMGPGGHGFGFLGEMRLHELQSRLNLTPEQTQKLQDIVKQERAKAFEQFGKGADDRLALAREIFKDSPNQAEIQRRAAALLEKHKQMLDQVVAAGVQVNSLFTPEQRSEVQKILDEKAQAAAQRRQHMRERMSQPPAPQQ
jgi:Spy/CpxP family protein refolding chaperone